VELITALTAQNAQLAGQVVFLQGEVAATRAWLALLEATPRPVSAAAPWW
jgi:hypothetical protein